MLSPFGRHVSDKGRSPMRLVPISSESSIRRQLRQRDYSARISQSEFEPAWLMRNTRSSSPGRSRLPVAFSLGEYGIGGLGQVPGHRHDRFLMAVPGLHSLIESDHMPLRMAL